jgi:hypothetical protein
VQALLAADLLEHRFEAHLELLLQLLLQFLHLGLGILREALNLDLQPLDLLLQLAGRVALSTLASFSSFCCAVCSCLFFSFSSAAFFCCSAWIRRGRRLALGRLIGDALQDDVRDLRALGERARRRRRGSGGLRAGVGAGGWLGAGAGGGRLRERRRGNHQGEGADNGEASHSSQSFHMQRPTRHLILLSCPRCCARMSLAVAVVVLCVLTTETTTPMSSPCRPPIRSPKRSARNHRQRRRHAHVGRHRRQTATNVPTAPSFGLGLLGGCVRLHRHANVACSVFVQAFVLCVRNGHVT